MYASVFGNRFAAATAAARGEDVEAVASVDAVTVVEEDDAALFVEFIAIVCVDVLLKTSNRSDVDNVNSSKDIPSCFFFPFSAFNR